jgi:hypothetical protein
LYTAGRHTFLQAFLGNLGVAVTLVDVQVFTIAAHRKRHAFTLEENIQMIGKVKIQFRHTLSSCKGGYIRVNQMRVDEWHWLMKLYKTALSSNTRLPSLSDRFIIQLSATIYTTFCWIVFGPTINTERSALCPNRTRFYRQFVFQSSSSSSISAIQRKNESWSLFSSPPTSHSNNLRGSRMEDVRYKHGVNYRTKPWRPGNWMRCYDCRMADSSGRTSDFILTNSRATSSFVRCDKIRRIVQPVSSMWQRLPKANQQAQEPCK